MRIPGLIGGGGGETRLSAKKKTRKKRGFESVKGFSFLGRFVFGIY